MSKEDFPPEVQEDGSVRVSPFQLDVHTFTQGLSILAVPVLGYVATRDRKLTKPEKYFLGAMAAGAGIVDTWLWLRFTDAKRRAREAGPDAAPADD
jgi:hypothetical protein